MEKRNCNKGDLTLSSKSFVTETKRTKCPKATLILNSVHISDLSIEVGETITLPYGEKAYVTNTGTSKHAVLQFGIPEGKQGNGITKIELIKVENLEKTYRIFFDNGNFYDFVVKDGESGTTSWGDIKGNIEDQVDLKNKFGTKQDILISGENIKTVNGESILGSGNIEIVCSSTAYESLSKVKDYLYQTTYTNLDYNYAQDYFKKRELEINVGACSTIRNGNFVGRNFDWFYSEEVSFIVSTPSNDGKYSTISVSSSIPGLTEEYMASGKYDHSKFKLLPFFATDGVNECGLSVSNLVVPSQYGITTGTVPTVEEREEVCTLMLVRYILDKFKSAREAVEYLTKYVSIYSLDTLKQMGYELHFMISDVNKTYTLEFVNNAIVSEDISNKPYMTNFFLTGVNYDSDGKVYTPATVEEGKLPSSQGITSLGSGLERYNLIVENYHLANTITGMQNLLFNSSEPSLRYTNSYKSETDPQWNTEFVGHWDFTDEEGQHVLDLTVNSPASDFEIVKNYVRNIYEHRERDGKTWQTEHSVVYDLTKKKLYVMVQEDGSFLDFGLNYYTKREIDEKFSNKQDVLVSGENIKTINGKSVLGSGNLDVVSTTFVFEQAVASDTWIIQHNLNKYPSVSVTDSAGSNIECAVIYTNVNNCVLRMNGEFKGIAYLN